MATINSDTVEGTLNEFGGKAEGFIGDVTGDTKTQAEGKIDELKGKVQDVYGKAREKVTEWADNAPESVQRARETASRYAAQGTEKAKAVVQEQPVAIIAGGVALGFLLGWLVSGRRD
ncbi:CsbD family protein [Glacieibacterium frigidum]|nr:CsbD family protein [Glacieibacterium frigidum]